MHKTVDFAPVGGQYGAFHRAARAARLAGRIACSQSTCLVLKRTTMSDPFLDQLASLCREHVTRAKWVFVSSHAVGHPGAVGLEPTATVA